MKRATESEMYCLSKRFLNNLIEQTIVRDQNNESKHTTSLHDQFAVRSVNCFCFAVLYVYQPFVSVAKEALFYSKSPRVFVRRCPHLATMRPSAAAPAGREKYREKRAIETGGGTKNTLYTIFYALNVTRRRRREDVLIA